MLAAACWLLAFAASQCPGKGLGFHFKCVLLTFGFILVLGVSIRSYLGDPRLFRKLPEEVLVAEAGFCLIWAGFGVHLGAHWVDLGEPWASKSQPKWSRMVLGLPSENH
jgi:hypothetical protein